MDLVVAALTRRRRVSGAQPLLTYYDLGTGERTEVSATTFANWADKLAHAYLAMDVEPGDLVAIPLLWSHPGHWVGLAAATAAWQVGAVVTPRADAAAVVSVIGPGTDAADVAGQVGVASLHPFALPVTDLPDGAWDVADVRSLPDTHVEVPSLGDDPAWVDPVAGTLTQADLVAVGGTADRTLVRPHPGWPAVRDCLLVPVVTGGSAVVVVGDGDASAIATVEKVTASTT